MKKVLVLTLLLGICSIAFSQANPMKPKKGETTKRMTKDTTAKVDTAASIPTVDVSQGPPPGSTTFILMPDQVKLLQYVIDQSDAGHRSVVELATILRNQQYVAPSLKKDSTAAKK